MSKINNIAVTHALSHNYDLAASKFREAKRKGEKKDEIHSQVEFNLNYLTFRRANFLKENTSKGYISIIFYYVDIRDVPPTTGLQVNLRVFNTEVEAPDEENEDLAYNDPTLCIPKMVVKTYSRTKKKPLQEYKGDCASF